ncbi:MAG: hypothetical protein A2017_14675 [Lentisphaerae bacterium GWF2_44_16]|nr:MAG: hypothetical protein A2017_14675 [Lentisphaerae bacterium GWF2_44_16]
MISLRDGGIYLQCWVQPKASANAIKGIHGDALKISLMSPPVDGKANAALCAFMAEKLSVPKSAVKINSGLSSRKKKLFISGISIDKFLKVFCA